MKIEYTFEAGALWYGRIRKLLKQIKKNYPDFDYIEGIGILSKKYVLHGEKELIKTIIKSFPESD
jgi:hypothetical protein